MSVLSSSKYYSITQAIVLLKAQINEETQEEQSKFQLISIKIKLIEQQTQQAKQYFNKYYSQTSSRVEAIAQSSKNALKEMIDSHPNSIGLQDLERQLKELQNCRDKLTKSVKIMSNQAAEKLQAQIDQLQAKVDLRSQEHRKQIKEVENQLKKQIVLTTARLKQNQQMLEQTEEIEALQLIGERLKKELSSIRERRLQRKQNFLNLLQTIVAKCKQDSQQQ